MKVALFPSAFYPSLGGVEELSHQLASELIAGGHEVMVVTNRWPRSLPTSEVIDGIQVFRPALRTRGAGLKSEITHFLTSSRILNEVKRLLRKTKIDLIHSICIWPGTAYALDAARDLGIPHITTLQGELTMDASRIYERSELARSVLRRALTESAAITACSQKTLDDAENFLGRSIQRPKRVIFNGASKKDFQGIAPLKQDRKYILALGRLVPQKGFDFLLHTIASHPHCLPEDWELLIAGDGPERQSLTELSKKLGLAQRVVFFGRADHGTVVRLMLGSEFIVVPSRSDEGLPVVCAEAIAASKPVIGTRKGGIPEAILHDTNGLIVESENQFELAAAIKRLSDNPHLRNSMSAAAKARYIEFSWDQIASNYLEVYHQVIERKDS
jgi:glycogen(starch) synthase